MTQRFPFRYFKTSPEVIRPAVMMYVRFPLSLRRLGLHGALVAELGGPGADHLPDRLPR